MWFSGFFCVCQVGVTDEILSAGDGILPCPAYGVYSEVDVPLPR